LWVCYDHSSWILDFVADGGSINLPFLKGLICSALRKLGKQVYLVNFALSCRCCCTPWCCGTLEWSLEWASVQSFFMLIRVFWLVIIIRHPDCWYHFILEAENCNSNLPVLYVELYSTKKLWELLTPTSFLQSKQIEVSHWDMKSKFLTPAFLHKIVDCVLSLNAWHEYSSHAILVLTYLSCMVKNFLI
jgi:hypothetical protein